MTSLIAYTAFSRAYELGSFSAVGRELGMTQSTVSKHIAALEANLGVQLFARTTRRLNATHEAAQLYENVQHLLDAADAIHSSLGGTRAEPRGLLRITMPDSYGRSQMMPKIAAFLAKYPKVRLDISLTDQPLNLIAEGVELGIRIGNLASSTLVARPLGIAEHLVVATPRYLAVHGEPNDPTDLAHHNCIVYTGSPKGNRWVFESESGRQVAEVPSSLALNSADAMYDAVMNDIGIAKVPAWIVGNDVARNKVRVLLPDFYPMPMPINIIYPQTRVLSLRARCFIDFLLDCAVVRPVTDDPAP